GAPSGRSGASPAGPRRGIRAGPSALRPGNEVSGSGKRMEVAVRLSGGGAFARSPDRPDRPIPLERAADPASFSGSGAPGGNPEDGDRAPPETLLRDTFAGGRL